MQQHLIHFFLVGLGGAIGAMARHGVNVAAIRLLRTDFPVGTLAVNIAGSLIIGILAGCFAHFSSWTQEMRLFLIVGILGGLTTFSSFSLDTISLFERGAYAQSCIYAVASCALSLTATLTGLWIVRQATF